MQHRVRHRVTYCDITDQITEGDQHDHSNETSSESASSLEEDSADEVILHVCCVLRHMILDRALGLFANHAASKRGAAALLPLQGEESAESSSVSASDTEDNIPAASMPPICEALHTSPDHHALSVQQRQQLRAALKQQLEDLKIELAAKNMSLLGI